MIEVYPHLWVGNDQDYQEMKDQPDWYFLQCAKDPYHRQALGYTGRAAPKDHPEYLYAYRENRLILNMVDADDPKYFSQEMIDEALLWIDITLQSMKIPLIPNDLRELRPQINVLIHCNKGESRAPSLALLWLAQGGVIPRKSLQAAEREFVLRYPLYNPGHGMNWHLALRWKSYMGEES